MSEKFDIRLRRKQFTEGRMQRYKNYESLMQRHRSSSRKRAWGVAIVIFIVILSLVIAFVSVGQPKYNSYSKQLHKTEIQSTGPHSLNR